MQGLNDQDILSLLRANKAKLSPVKAVAELLHLSPSTVYRLVEQGKLTAICTAKRNTLILESSIKQYLESLNPLILDK